MRILTVIAAVLLLGACSREAAPRPTPVSRPASTPTSRPAPSKSNPCIKASGLNGRVVYLAERGLCQHGYTFSRADEAKVIALVASMSLVEDPILACDGDECTILLLEAAK